MKSFIKKNNIAAYRTQDGSIWCEVGNDETSLKSYPCRSKEFEVEVKQRYLKQKKSKMEDALFVDLIQNLEMQAYSTKLDYNLATRVANVGNDVFYYLDEDENIALHTDVEEGWIEIVDTPSRLFKPTPYFKNQVEPNIDVDYLVLPDLISKHFNLNKKDALLLAIYLVTCLGGLDINIPILMVFGEKGASKSTFLRKAERIIDPKKNELITLPRGREELGLRLNNSFVLALDNISYITKDQSDLLAMAVTGGYMNKRALYKNTDEISLDLHTIILMNGINVSLREADVLDRALVFELKRINPKDYKPEKELWAEFDEDLPDILGACFQLLCIAKNDTRPIKVEKKIRMVDWMHMAVKVGRALGYSDEEVAELIWSNNKKVNEIAIDEDIVATCIVELMKNTDEYEASMSELLGDIQCVAESNNISRHLLPKQPNVLSRKLSQSKSNLDSRFGIKFQIKRGSSFKKITIWKI